MDNVIRRIDQTIRASFARPPMFYRDASNLEDATLAMLRIRQFIATGMEREDFNARYHDYCANHGFPEAFSVSSLLEKAGVPDHERLAAVVTLLQQFARDVLGVDLEPLSTQPDRE